MENKLGIESVKHAFIAILGMVKELKGKGLDVKAILFSLRNLLPIRFKKLKEELLDLTLEEKQEIIELLTKELPRTVVEKTIMAIETGQKISVIKIVGNLLKKK